MRLVQKQQRYIQIQKIIVTGVTIASVGLILFILFRTTNTNRVKNEYKAELNRLLKGCEEKIVEVSQKIETEGQNLVDVREFDEIIKVSEELFKPILFWNNEKEEESWFCAKDVCNALEIVNHKYAVSDFDEDEKKIILSPSSGGMQETLFVSESGLYRLIFKSRKEQAVLFRRWVTHEVLPSLRKTGSYSLSKAPEAELLREIQRLNEINERTNQKLDILIKQNEQKKIKKQLPKEPLPDDEKAMIISAICDLAQKNQRVKAYYPEFRKYLVSKFGRDVLPVHAKKYLEALAPELKEKGISLQRIGENIKIPHTRESQRGFIICG